MIPQPSNIWRTPPDPTSSALRIAALTISEELRPPKDWHIANRELAEETRRVAKWLLAIANEIDWRQACGRDASVKTILGDSA